MSRPPCERALELQQRPADLVANGGMAMLVVMRRHDRSPTGVGWPSTASGAIPAKETATAGCRGGGTCMDGHGGGVVTARREEGHFGVLFGLGICGFIILVVGR